MDSDPSMKDLSVQLVDLGFSMDEIDKAFYELDCVQEHTWNNAQEVSEKGIGFIR